MSVILVLLDELVTVPLDRLGDSPQSLAGLEFTDATHEYAPTYFTGFYDWLRLDGRLVGVRFTPLADLADLATVVAGKPYLGGEGSALLIYCGATHAYDQTTKPDQLFGFNAIYTSPSGDVAITPCFEEDEDREWSEWNAG